MISNEEAVNSVPLWKSYRLLIAVLLSFSFYCSTTMRTDLGIAMVCMVNATAFLESSNKTTSSFDLPCQGKNLSEALADKGYTGNILWPPKMQSLLFSANYYSSVLSVLPAGILADQFNPKLSLLFAIGDIALFTLLTPLLAGISFYAVFAARIVLGLGDAFMMPTMASVAARWFLPTERSTLAAVYTSGNQVATSTIYWIGAALCSSNFLGGWPSIFYILGFIGMIWMVIWSVLATSCPGENRFISKKEQICLNRNLGNPKKKLSRGRIPWLSIALSLPMISNLFSMFTASFIITLLQSFLPTYFKNVLLIDLKKNGLFTTLPFLSQLISKNILGILSDHLKKRGIMGPTTACKFFQVVGALLQTAAFFVLAYAVNCTTPALALAMLALQGIGAAAATPGAVTSLLCIAPAYTGTLMSLSMVTGQLGNGLAPSMVALFNKHGSPAEWSRVFVVTGIMNVCSAIFFGIFASAEEQPWATQKSLQC